LRDDNFLVVLRDTLCLRFETASCSDAILTSSRSDVRETGPYAREQG